MHVGKTTAGINVTYQSTYAYQHVERLSLIVTVHFYQLRLK